MFLIASPGPMTPAGNSLVPVKNGVVYVPIAAIAKPGLVAVLFKRGHVLVQCDARIWIRQTAQLFNSERQAAPEC